MACGKFIGKKYKINSFWSHSLSVGEDVASEVTCVNRIIFKDIVELETASEEGVGEVAGFGVEVTNEYDWVSPSRLLNKLKDFKQLAVTATRISLKK